MAQGREVFARFVQDLRAASGAVQDVESRMKQSAKLLEGLVSNPALRESSKTWRRWAKRGANGGDLSRPATGRAQARGDWKNSGTGKTVIGELGLFTDEGASVQREAALPESSKDRKITCKHQKADLTPFCGRRYSPASPRCLDLPARRRRVGQVRQETKVRARGGRRHQGSKFVAPNT